ncbi:Cysteine protease [Entamoeba marina]
MIFLVLFFIFTSLAVEKHVNEIVVSDVYDLPNSLSYCGDYVEDNINIPRVDFCSPHIFNQSECNCCYASVLASYGEYIYSKLSYDESTHSTEYVNISVQRILDTYKGNTNDESNPSGRCCSGNVKEVLNNDSLLTYLLYSAENYEFVDGSNTQCDIRVDGIPDVNDLNKLLAITEYYAFGFNEGDASYVSNLKKVLKKYGPFISQICASDSFTDYDGGIIEFTEEDCSCDADLIHYVLVVGYGSDTEGEYLIIRNSYGDDWGESGYMRISNNNLCKIGASVNSISKNENLVLIGYNADIDDHCSESLSEWLLCSGSCQKPYKFEEYDYSDCLELNKCENIGEVGVCKLECDYFGKKCSSCNDSVCLECLNVKSGISEDELELCGCAIGTFEDDSGSCIECSEVISECYDCDNSSYCLTCSDGKTSNKGVCVSDSSSTAPIIIISVVVLILMIL